jgi:hypothetical protein
MHTKTDYGYEHDYRIRYGSLAQPADLTLVLYDDSVDDIQPDGDIGDITTRPAGSAYADQSVDPSNYSLSFDAGRWNVLGPDTTFDVTDSSRNVDSYGVADTFQASSDSSATQHLLYTGALGDDIDLSARESTYVAREFGERDPS